MKLTITINKSEILFEIKNRAFYTGETLKEEAPRISALMQPSSDDNDLLESFITTAIGDIISYIPSFTYSFSDIEDFILEIDAPENFDTNQTLGLTKAISDYLTEYSLFKFYQRVYPKLADSEGYIKLLYDINHRLNKRTGPVVRSPRILNI